MLSRYVSVAGMVILCTACAGTGVESDKIKALQRKDKNLTCKEVLLEMNEANFYKRTAEKNRGPKLSNVLMPLGYISTYLSAEDAIEASEARIEYLDKIYEIMDCETRSGADVPVFDG